MLFYVHTYYYIHSIHLIPNKIIIISTRIKYCLSHYDNNRVLWCNG